MQWLSFHYKLNNPEGKNEVSSQDAYQYAYGGSRMLTRCVDIIAGEAYVIVNDEPAVNISSLNSRAGYHDSTPVQLKLKSGDVNTITFGAMGNDGMYPQVYEYSPISLTSRD